jgi:hypothetical protein
MPKRTFTTEQIALLLRQIEVLMSQGKANVRRLSRSEYFAAHSVDRQLNAAL